MSDTCPQYLMNILHRASVSGSTPEMRLYLAEQRLNRMKMCVLGFKNPTESFTDWQQRRYQMNYSVPDNIITCQCQGCHICLQSNYCTTMCNR